jgi:hypothetical protein
MICNRSKTVLTLIKRKLKLGTFLKFIYLIKFDQNVILIGDNLSFKN